MVKRGRSKTGLPLLSSNRYPALERSLIVRFPHIPQQGDTHQPSKLTSGSLCAPSPSLGNSLSTGVSGRCPFMPVPFLPFLVQTLAPCARVRDVGCCPTAISAEGPSLWASGQISTSHDKCQSSACHQVLHLSSLSHRTVPLEEVQTETVFLKGSVSNGHIHADF